MRTLLRLDRRRLAAQLRHPAAGPLLALLLPLVLLVGILWAVGRTASPSVADAESAPAAGAAGVGAGRLPRLRNHSSARRTSRCSGGSAFPPGALYAERLIRFLLVALATAAVAMVPFLAAGTPPGRPAAVAIAAAVAAWGSGALAASGAARSLAAPGPRRPGLLAIGIWDAEVRGIAPLLYAPLVPFMVGTVAATFVGASAGIAGGRLLLVSIMAIGMALLGRRSHAAALPRFAPQALEMSFEPAPSGVGEMSVGRGAGRLLPRGAAAVWVRDSLMVSRRFAWAPRLVWPVVIISFIGLARWGADPATRGWVAAAALLALLTQAIAAIALGRLERGGARWIDRSLGLTPARRLLGRWAWGFGASLWLTIPLSLSWAWWAGVGPAWAWVAAGAGTAAAGAVGSLTAAGWR